MIGRIPSGVQELVRVIDGDGDQFWAPGHKQSEVSVITMQHIELTLDQIEERCTEQSFTRGLDYFDAEAIGNPALQGSTLSATCEGSMEELYRVSVELMPTGIADADCSCPYSYEGDCKHIVALLLTYLHDPEAICSLEPLLATLESKPKSTLLQVISELLKRAPELAFIVEVYSDPPVE